MSSTESPRGSSYDLEEKGAGWVFFAASMLALAGIVGLIDGIVTATKSSFYVSDARYVFSGPQTWGWIMIIMGAITILAAFGIFRGATWARLFGIGIAGLQALVQLLSIRVVSLLVAVRLRARHPRDLRPRAVRDAAAGGLARCAAGSHTPARPSRSR